MGGAEEAMADGEVACGEVDEGFGNEVGGDFAVGGGRRGGEEGRGVVEVGERADAGAEDYSLREGVRT